jgi:nucleoside-diphosphate-sugar epimerase
LFYNFLKKFPFWPLGLFKIKRSFCDIDNFNFIIEKLILNGNIESGIYHIADDTQYDLSILYSYISNSFNKKPRIFFVPKFIIKFISLLGTLLKLPFNSYRFNKLTSSLLVSNTKIKKAINSDLPFGGYSKLVNSLKSN